MIDIEAIRRDVADAGDGDWENKYETEWGRSRRAAARRVMEAVPALLSDFATLERELATLRGRLKGEKVDG